MISDFSVEGGLKLGMDKVAELLLVSYNVTLFPEDLFFMSCCSSKFKEICICNNFFKGQAPLKYRFCSFITCIIYKHLIMLFPNIKLWFLPLLVLNNNPLHENLYW